MGLLEKYRKQSYLAKNYDDLETDLIAGIKTAEFPPWLLIRTYCTDCDESCLAIKHKGKRHLVHDVGGRLTLHQCPQAVDEVYPDDPNVRDGDGNIRTDDWSDDQDRRHDQFPDDPYNYPDIPYVDPTRGNHR